jgi:predicted NUDIX family NTP pyrophosphohydrolase
MKISAGLLMHRMRDDQLEVLLVHPGGPFWIKKDVGAWFIPKGEIAAGEDPLTAAQREFMEETGLAPTGPFLSLGRVRHKNGKIVHAWAFEADCDATTLRSNTFTMEWPPRSGQQMEFPEVDRAAFFSITGAQEKMYPVEFELALRLRDILRKQDG